MDSRELVKTAISHNSGPRVPYNITLTAEMRDRLAGEQGIKDVEGWLDNDVINIFPPWWDWYELAEDWKGFEAPTSKASVIGTGSYDGFIETVKKAAAESGKYILVLIYGSHFEKANFARGIENFLADMAGSYSFAKKLCNTIIEKNLVMLENLLSLREIDGVLLGSDWGTQRGLLFSAEIWDDLIRPGEQREYDLVHSYEKDVWVHSCGNIAELIPRLAEMGVDVLNPIQPECMDIYKLKKEYGDKMTFWGGGISTQSTLPNGTAKEVLTEARQTRKVMSENGGYIFAAGQEIQDDIPFENLEALLEAARENE